MENVEKIKRLLNNATEIKDLFQKKIPIWKAEPQKYDKTRWGFEQGNNDGWYADQTITLHFGAWAGTYGCSSVYKKIDLDGGIFRQHFLRYLNNNKEQIMLAVAESIEKEATDLKEKAEAELNKELTKLQNI